MNKIHKIISNLPYVIIFYWLFCALFLIDLEFYKINFELFDYIDTIIVCFTLVHFLLFYNLYSYDKKKFIVSIVMIISLNFCYFVLNESSYYFLFFVFLFTPIIITIWKKMT